MGKGVHLNAPVFISRRYLRADDLPKYLGGLWAQACLIELDAPVFDCLLAVLEESVLLLTISVRDLEVSALGDVQGMKHLR